MAWGKNTSIRNKRVDYKTKGQKNELKSILQMGLLSGASSIVGRTENILMGFRGGLFFLYACITTSFVYLQINILAKFLSFLCITVWMLNKRKTFYKGLFLVYLNRVSVLNPSSVNLISKVLLRPSCSYAIFSICLFNIISFCPLWI